MTEVHENFMRDIPLCISNGRTPTLMSLQNLMKRNNTNGYIADRSKITSRGRLYTDASYHLCVAVNNLDKGDLLQRAACIRMTFDKYYQPWNIERWAGREPALCLNCGLLDSFAHMVMDCDDPQSELICAEGRELCRAYLAGQDTITDEV